MMLNRAKVLILVTETFLFNLVSEFGNRAKIEFNAVWLDCKIYAFKRQFLFMKGKILCL